MVGLSDFSLGLLAQSCVEAGDFKNLDSVVKTLVHQRPTNSALAAIEAFTKHRLGREGDATAALTRAMQLDASEPLVNYFAGRLTHERGQHDTALRHFGVTVDAMPWFKPAYDSLLQILFPGLEYLDVLTIIHCIFKPEVYLEIGVNTGTSLALAATADIAIGIDPDLSDFSAELGQNAQLFAKTSDDFFTSLDRATVMRNRAVDLGFIDGLHLFEFCLRDFISIERLSRPGGMILIHDVVPVCARVAERERSSPAWMGDVWKILPCLAEQRPDLDVTLIMTAPSGLAVIRNLDPSSTVLANGNDGIMKRFVPMSFPGPHFWKELNVRPIAAEPAEIRQLLTDGGR